MENGAFSMKRVSAFMAFWLAQAYIITVHVFGWDVMQFVYEWLMGWAAYVITGTVVDKKLINKSMSFGVETERVEKTKIKKVDGKPDEIG
jgi:hypothetical protein